MPWFSFRLRTLVVISAALLVAACEGRKKTQKNSWGNAVAATAAAGGAFALVPDGQYVRVEATRKDKENMKENEPDCYLWPKACNANVTGFVDGAGSGEPVQALHLDAGLYDVELFYGPAGSSEETRWKGRLADVRVDTAGATHEVTVVSPDGQQMLVLQVRLQAESEVRPDGSICDDGNGAVLTACSPDDQHYKCTVGAFTSYGCSKAQIYDALELELCDAKLDMKKSEFAAAFTCSEVAVSEVPLP
jgi:hypothetical protein